MYQSCLIYYILFIPIINSHNITLKTTGIDHNITTKSEHIMEEKIENKKLSTTNTTLIMVSKEEDSQTNNSILALPKDNHSIDLETIDKEFGTTKLKQIQARKGVPYQSEELMMPHSNLDTIPISLMEEKTVTEKVTKKIDNIETVTKKSHKTSQGEIKNLSATSTLDNVNKNKVHKKPLVLSSDALDTDKIMHNVGIIPFVKSSSNTLVTDQIPPPNRDVKSYNMATKHPGLVTPVVITILVVPVFAVLGYMAFKRGKEAWKNRHYKRMDFLLDGMYNE